MLQRRVVRQQRRLVHTLTVGLRREDPTRIWERRCPLTPTAVNELVRDGARVLVQPCDRRVFPIREFVEAGAEVHDTLQPANVVLGIKETPLSELDTLLNPLDGRPRTHVMFSHTIKGQHYNMPLLERFLREPSSPTLIDHELLTNDNGCRTVGFGWFAGAAGAVEGLITSAHDHLQLGIASPFLQLARPYTHTSLASMIEAVRTVQPIPSPLTPYIVAVTGRGNVGRGALDILRELPGLQEIPASALPDIIAQKEHSANIYLVHVKPEDYIFRKDGGGYERESYYATPDAYVSRFHELIAPYVSLFVNGTGWQPGFPRLMTNDQLALAVQSARAVGPTRFRTIADVSCDIEGGLEFLHRSTTICDPSYTISVTPGQPNARDLSMMAVDILPTELPRDASKHFSDKLTPYLRWLIGLKSEEIEQETALRAMERASIAKGGKLTEKWTWLGERVAMAQAPEATSTPQSTQTSSSPSKSTTIPVTGSGSPGGKKRVLLLGSGMVAKPAVDEFLRRSDVSLVVASNNRREAHEIVRGRANAEVIQLDITDGDKVDSLIDQADVVVSLLPVPFHVGVAERCIAKQKHMVTASYISPGMRELHERAAAAGVVLLNEIGLDPGIDHVSAIDMRQRLEAQGKKITHFASFCGGLPAPESAATDGSGLGYKFSWSPRGVLTAARNGARYKLDGTVYTMDGQDLLRRGSYFPDVPVSNVLALEGLANRDSLSYASTYGLGPVHGLNTLIRGTLRYRGFADLMHAFKSLGLLDDEPQHKFGLNGGGDWRQLLNKTLSLRVKSELKDEKSVHKALLDVVNERDADNVVASLEWLGLLGKAHVSELPPLPSGSQTALDHFAALLARRLRYLPDERDLVVLAHEIVARTPSGAEETWTSQLTLYGSRNESAMSRAVGLPVALAALRVVDGAVRVRGVIGPGDEPDVLCKGLLGDLEASGLGMRETVKKGRGKVSRALTDVRKARS